MAVTNFDPVNEDSSALYTATLVAADGTPIGSSLLQSLTLSLYDTATGEFINSRELQDALNDNNVTVSVLGEIQWEMQPEDNPILNDEGTNETHVAQFYAVWNGGASAQAWKVVVRVEQFQKALS